MEFYNQFSGWVGIVCSIAFIGSAIYLKTEAGLCRNTIVRYMKCFKKFTNMALAKEWMRKNPQIRLILFGGELNRDREAFEGQTVLEQMKTCFINYAFVSSAGCSLEAGITDSTREEADIRRQVLKQAKHKILVVDNTKIGRNEVYVIGELEQLSQVVVDHSIRKTNPDLWEWFRPSAFHHRPFSLSSAHFVSVPSNLS